MKKTVSPFSCTCKEALPHLLAGRNGKKNKNKVMSEKHWPMNCMKYIYKMYGCEIIATYSEERNT